MRVGGRVSEAEIGRLLGIPDKDAKLMVRDIRSHLTDWRPERIGDVWLFSARTIC
jgi:hypothetical protein